MTKLLWRVRCTYWFVHIMRTYDIGFYWRLSEVSLENVGYDTTEDPRECVIEELSCWGRLNENTTKQQ